MDNINSTLITDFYKTVPSIECDDEKNSDFRVEKSCLEILNLSFEVQEDLRKAESLENKLKVIDTWDLSPTILSYFNPKELGQISIVSKSWATAASKGQIQGINERKLKLQELLEGFTAKAAVDWLTNNPHCASLQFADFTGFNDFDNECLEKLTKNCPNLKHLFLKHTNIQGDGLRHLINIPGLLSLEIGACQELEIDALKHLIYIKGLLNLNLFQCTKLEPDALKHLIHTPNLQTLKISWCTQFDQNSLEYLIHTAKLLFLNISWCKQLKADPFKELKITPELQSLKFSWCNQFDTSLIPEPLRLWLVLIN